MRRFLRVLTVVLLAVAGSQPLAAADEAAAQRSLTVGIEAYRQGSLEASIEALTEALQGRLFSRQAAKAFYYRGLAYRALGKPGQAIADFDAAIAQPNGLSFGQLADAEDNRTAAQQEAGIAAGETVVSAIPEKNPGVPPGMSSARKPQPQSFLTTTSISPAEAEPSVWGAATVAPRPAPSATPVIPDTAPRSAPPAGIPKQVARLPAPTVVPSHPESAAAPFATRVDTAPRSQSSAGIPAQVARPPATTVAPPHPEGAATPFATQVVPSPAQRYASLSPSAAQIVPAAAQPAPLLPATGTIRVQVARVQTQSEAYALVVRLISQHGAEFDPTMLKIERGVADGKTVAYLVRLGPFADADQAQKRCSMLRRTGFDCVVQY